MDYIDYNVQTPAVYKDKLWFWKPDGKVVDAKTEMVAKEFKSQGWRKLSPDEIKRFKPGDYHPVYDLRGKDIKSIQLPEVTHQQSVGDVLHVILV